MSRLTGNSLRVATVSNYISNSSCMAGIVCVCVFPYRWMGFHQEHIDLWEVNESHATLNGYLISALESIGEEIENL